MFKKFWNWFINLFKKSGGKDLVSQLVENIGSNDGKTDLGSIVDPNIGEKAIEYVKELNERTDMTGAEKAAEFNKKLASWALKTFGKVLSTALINLVREIAVNLVKAAIVAI